MAALLAAVRLTRGRPLPVCWAGTVYSVRGRWRQGLVFSGAALLQAAGVLLLVWACYGFRFSAFAVGEPGEFDRAWSVVLDQPGPSASVLRAVWTHRLLPEAYLYGQSFVLKYADRRAAYLNGRVSWTGWRYYFPYCFAVKTPLPTFAVLLLAAGTLLRRRKQTDS